MKTGWTVWLAASLLAASATAGAAQTVTRDRGAMHHEQIFQKTTVDERHAASRGSSARGQAMARIATQGYGGRNGPYANPYRTYPPSCMADPLPMTPIGPVYRRDMDMASWNQNLGGYVREEVTVMIWRVPCSSSNYYNAVTLLRIQRDDDYEGDTNQYVVFPGVRLAQGDVDFDDPYGFDLPRLAPEPNTIVSWTPVDSAMVDSTTYVLEAFPLPDRPFFDYAAGFSLRMDNFINDGGRHQYVINVPPYDPSDYATANDPLPINGYMSANYYDPLHSGEGMVVNILEKPSQGVYQLAFKWFTFGPDGQPFWITGTQQVTPGQRLVTVRQAGYLDDGGFAGDFGSQAAAHAWGTVTFSWDDCNHLTISYNSRDGLPSHVPQGSGTLDWTRIANTNGLTCE